VATAAYFIFGGLALWRTQRAAKTIERPAALSPRHWLTLGVLAGWIAGVVVFRANVGLSAFAAAALLIIAGAAEDNAAMSAVPWAVIVMVCGVSVLVGVIEKTGGMDLFTTLLARITTPGTANGMMAFVT